jgi:hypothetical protein
MIPHILLNGFLEITVDPQLCYTPRVGSLLPREQRDFIYCSSPRQRSTSAPYSLASTTRAMHVLFWKVRVRLCRDQAILGTRRPTFEFRLAN